MSQEKEDEYLSKLSFKQVDKKELSSLEADTSLFIIGNGFDLMHGIPSSYYNFRDSISRNNRVRFKESSRGLTSPSHKGTGYHPTFVENLLMS